MHGHAHGHARKLMHALSKRHILFSDWLRVGRQAGRQAGSCMHVHSGTFTHVSLSFFSYCAFACIMQKLTSISSGHVGMGSG